MKLAIGSDHGGLEYKNLVRKHLIDLGHEIIDCGTHTLDSCHYPIYSYEVAKNVGAHKTDLGIVICTSGEGVMIVANKVKGVRCGMGYNDEVSHLMVEHNNANVIAFGQKFMNIEDVLRRVDIFLNAKFLGERHKIRTDMISDIEDKEFK